jgi:Tfp pilus assembly protein PilO
MWRMSKPMSRAAAIALLVAVLAVLAFGIVLPIVQGFDDRAQSVEGQRQELAEYLAVAGQDASVRNLEQRRQAELALGEFLPGDSELVAQADLQSKLNNFAQTSGLRIRSARKLPDRERGSVKTMGMGISLTADIESVVKFLYAIETARPYLLVEAAEISPMGGANPATVGPHMLEVRLDIYAAVQRTASP